MQEGKMEIRRDELDEASCQLMMDIQTGRLLEAPRPPRGRRFLGVGLVILGGLTGLLLASGHLMSETPHSGKDTVSPLIVPLAQSQAKAIPNVVQPLTSSPTVQPDAPLAAASSQESLLTDSQQGSPRHTNPRAKQLARSPEAQASSKLTRKRPTRLSKAARECNCPVKERPQKTARQPSFHISRSPAYEFDRNAELVQSTP